MKKCQGGLKYFFQEAGYFQYGGCVETYQQAGSAFTLYAFDKQFHIPGLCSRITAYIDNFSGAHFQDLFHNILMHACPGGISDDHIGLSIFTDKCPGKKIFHIPSKKLSILNIVELALISLASSMASGTDSIPTTFWPLLQ